MAYKFKKPLTSVGLSVNLCWNTSLRFNNRKAKTKGVPNNNSKQITDTLVILYVNVISIKKIVSNFIRYHFQNQIYVISFI